MTRDRQLAAILKDATNEVLLVTGDVHSAIASIVQNKTDLSETAPENQTVERFSKFAGAVGLEAQMLSLAYKTFPRNYLDPETLRWSIASKSLQPTFTIIGPTALALVDQGYALSHKELRNDFYTIQRVGTMYNEPLFRRLGDRSSQPPKRHADFRPLDVSRLLPDAVVKTILVSAEADDFLTKAEHIDSLVTPTKQSSLPWIVCKLRWKTDGDNLGSTLKLFQRLADKETDQGRVGSRLACVVSADNIRRSNLPISNRLSWERTTQETIERLTEKNEVSNALRGCRIVVVSFLYEGALIGVATGKNDERQWWLVYEPDTIEGDTYATTKGTTRGRLSTLACSLAHCLHLWGDDACQGDSAMVVEAVRRGLVAARLSHLRGLTKTPQSCTSPDVLPALKPIQALQTGYDPISSEIIMSQPYDVMAEVIRHDDLDKVTWVPMSAEAGNPDKTAKLHRRLKSVTQIIDDCFSQSRRVSVTKIDHPGFPDDKPGQSRFEKTWWSLLADCTRAISKDASGGDDDNRQYEAMRDLARLSLIYGPSVLSAPEERARKKGGRQVPLAVPVLRYGDFSAIDRAEIETYREIYALISQADRSGFRAHINIGVFGEPGSGKSFAIKEIVKSLKSDQIASSPIIKDLSQFTTERDLDEAFREIADVVLQGKVPIVFWDEYDSSRGDKEFGWLQSFLEPMQARHHSSGFIGRSVFIFAGSRFRSSDEIQLADLYASLGLDGKLLSEADFGSDRTCADICAELYTLIEPKARNASKAELTTAALLYESLRPTLADREKYEEFIASKGRDFKSRLTRTIDVTGVNSLPTRSRRTPHSHLVKRAMLSRETLFTSFRTLFVDEKRSGRLNIAPQVADAILSNVKYVHGARSLETILRACSALGATQLTPSHLPMDDQLRLHVDDVSAFERAFARG